MKYKALLERNFTEATKAAEALDYAFQKCKRLQITPPFNWETQETVESLTARFARLSDIIVQKLLKTIEKVDQDTPGTVRDRILAAEKKELITSAETFLEIRTLRNTLTHDYMGDELESIYQEVMKFTPVLLETLPLINQYIKRY